MTHTPPHEGNVPSNLGSDDHLYMNPKVNQLRVAEPLAVEQARDSEEERRLSSFRDAAAPDDEPGVTHTTVDRPPPADEEHPEFEELPTLA